MIQEGLFRDCSSLKAITIPNKVKYISRGAFEGCQNLKSIVLGHEIDSIANLVFYDCDNLNSIQCLNTTPCILSSNTFNQKHYSTTTLSVPNGALKSYQQADIWEKFMNIQEIIIVNPGFETQGNQYWIHFANGKGTLDSGDGTWKLDYDVNDGGYINFSTNIVTNTPCEGERYLDCWASYLNKLDMYQNIKGLSKGRYQVCANLRNIDSYAHITDQHIYAEIEGKEYSSLIMSEASVGRNIENWEKLITASFEVQSEEQEIRIGVRSTGDGTSAKGWFQADDFKLLRVDDETGVNSVKYKANYGDVKTENGVIVVENYIGTVNIYDLSGRLVREVSSNGGRTEVMMSLHGVYVVKIGDKAVKVAL